MNRRAFLRGVLALPFVAALPKPAVAACPRATTPAPPQGLFGDGSDGDVVIDRPVTLLRDMYYNNLTLAPGGALIAGGYMIRAKGFITFAGGSVRR